MGAFTITQKLPAGRLVVRSHCSPGINEMAKKSKLLKRVCARHNMKNEYGFYGKSTARLEASLGAGDREILERYLTFCSTSLQDLRGKTALPNLISCRAGSEA